MSGPGPPTPSPKGRGSVLAPPPLWGGGRGTGPSPRDRANAEQLSASDPAVSAFVGASAGSGKTKLLTDRLLRLMLTGAKPERIQCLTFTKAAAAEMSVRLQKTLGKWVTLDDAALARELRALAVEPAAADPARRARAVREGAGPAGRHAHRHHPRLLPVAAAALPAGGGAVAAFQSGRRSRRRGRSDRGTRDHAGACQLAAFAGRARNAGRPRIGGSVRPTRRDACRPICRGCGAPSIWARPWKRRSVVRSA